jgi:hypothetical protein
LNNPFFLFLSLFLSSSLLLCTSLLLWRPAQYKWRRQGCLPSLNHSQVEVDFPLALDPPKAERYLSVVGLMGSYDYVSNQSNWVVVPTRQYPLCNAPPRQDPDTSAIYQTTKHIIDIRNGCAREFCDNINH